MISYPSRSYHSAVQSQTRQAVSELSKKFPKFPVVFIGYSFGAPAATLAAADIIVDEIVDKKRVHLWTYGSPRYDPSSHLQLSCLTHYNTILYCISYNLIFYMKYLTKKWNWTNLLDILIVFFAGNWIKLKFWNRSINKIVVEQHDLRNAGSVISSSPNTLI